MVISADVREDFSGRCKGSGSNCDEVWKGVCWGFRNCFDVVPEGVRVCVEICGGELIPVKGVLFTAFEVD